MLLAITNQNLLTAETRVNQNTKLSYVCMTPDHMGDCLNINNFFNPVAHF